MYPPSYFSVQQRYLEMSELDLSHGSYTDGLGVHGSMFLAIDGDITAVEARFLGRLAGVGFCAEVERGSGEVEREKVDGMGLVAGREGGREEAIRDRLAGMRVLRVSGVFNAGRVLRFPAVVEAPDASKRGDSISGRAS